MGISLPKTRRLSEEGNTRDSEKVLPEVNLGTQGLLNGSNQSSGIGIKINLNFFYKGEKVTAEQDWKPGYRKEPVRVSQERTAERSHPRTIEVGEI